MKTMAAFSRKSSFATVIKFFNMIGLALSFSLDLNVLYKLITSKNFTVAKLLFLLNAAIVLSFFALFSKTKQK